MYKGQRNFANGYSARNKRIENDMAEMALSAIRHQGSPVTLDIEADDLLHGIESSEVANASYGKQLRRKPQLNKPNLSVRQAVPAVSNDSRSDRFYGLDQLVGNMGLKGRGRIHDPKMIHFVA